MNWDTMLSHPDHSRVVVPNRKIVGEILHNYGQIRQVEVTVALAYDADELPIIDDGKMANPVLLH